MIVNFFEKENECACTSRKLVEYIYIYISFFWEVTIDADMNLVE